MVLTRRRASMDRIRFFRLRQLTVFCDTSAVIEGKVRMNWPDAKVRADGLGAVVRLRPRVSLNGLSHLSLCVMRRPGVTMNGRE